MNNPIQNINPQHTSNRLFFVKESVLQTVWHVCDASIWTKRNGVTYYFALHCGWVKAALTRNSVDKLDSQHAAGDILCQACLDELAIASNVVKERKMLQFQDLDHKKEAA